MRRTVRQYERSGIAALHLEDQDFPKRCGHLDDKRVIPTEDMVQKIHAAVDARTDDDFTIIVRTDAIAVTGWDDAMRRCEEYVTAGADVLFVEALRTPEQIEQAGVSSMFLCSTTMSRRKVSPPPGIGTGTDGFKIVIYPASGLLSAMHAVRETLATLKQQGTTSHLLENMDSLQDCFETVACRRCWQKTPGSRRPTR